MRSSIVASTNALAIAAASSGVEASAVTETMLLSATGRDLDLREQVAPVVPLASGTPSSSSWARRGDLGRRDQPGDGLHRAQRVDRARGQAEADQDLGLRGHRRDQDPRLALVDLVRPEHVDDRRAGGQRRPRAPPASDARAACVGSRPARGPRSAGAASRRRRRSRISRSASARVLGADCDSPSRVRRRSGGERDLASRAGSPPRARLAHRAGRRVHRLRLPRTRRRASTPSAPSPSSSPGSGTQIDRLVLVGRFGPGDAESAPYELPRGDRVRRSALLLEPRPAHGVARPGRGDAAVLACARRRRLRLAARPAPVHVPVRCARGGAPPARGPRRAPGVPLLHLQPPPRAPALAAGRVRARGRLPRPGPLLRRGRRRPRPRRPVRALAAPARDQRLARRRGRDRRPARRRPPLRRRAPGDQRRPPGDGEEPAAARRDPGAARSPTAGRGSCWSAERASSPMRLRRGWLELGSATAPSCSATSPSARVSTSSTGPARCSCTSPGPRACRRCCSRGSPRRPRSSPPTSAASARRSPERPCSSPPGTPRRPPRRCARSSTIQSCARDCGAPRTATRSPIPPRRRPGESPIPTASRLRG